MKWLSIQLSYEGNFLELFEETELITDKITANTFYQGNQHYLDL